MRKEERTALMQSRDFEWEDFDGLPQVVQNLDEKDEIEEKKTKSKRTKDKVKESLDSQEADTKIDSMHLSSSFMRSEIRLDDIAARLDNIALQSGAISKQIQEILNFSIRQLEMFEKLTHKFPNIRVFHNAFDETQDIIEKIIKVQDESRECMRDSLNALEIVEAQRNEHKSTNEIVEMLIMLSGCMEKIISGELSVKALRELGRNTQVDERSDEK